MADIRLGEFNSDQVVLHFGGPRSVIDAVTLADSLKSFSLLVHSVGEVINPEETIELEWNPIILDRILRR